MRKPNYLSLFLTIISFGFLIPGVTLSLIRISSQGNINAPLTKIGIHLFDTSNSLLQTVNELFKQDYYFVAIMIFLFSVIFPVMKGVILIVANLHRNPFTQKQLEGLMQTLTKWSMCDVFIVAVFLAFLSTGSRSQGQTHETSLLGIPIDINLFVTMNAQLEIGFYCFLTYCLLSLAALQLYEKGVQLTRVSPQSD